MKMKELIKKYKLQSFSKNFDREVDWKTISIFYELPENFIREFKNEIDWFFVFSSQKLSEDFIREFENEIDWVNWNVISWHQKLSEDFVREFKNKVNWAYIYENQNLSLEFIKEFQKNIDFAIKNGFGGYALDSEISSQFLNFTIKEMEKLKKQENVNTLVIDTYDFYNNIVKNKKIRSKHYLIVFVNLICSFLEVDLEWEEFKIQEFKNQISELTGIEELFKL